MGKRFAPEIFHDVSGEPISNSNWIHASAEAATLWALHESDPAGRHGNRYWNISGDIVSEMSAAEKDAVDAAEAAANVTSVKNEVIANVDVARESGDPIGLTERALIQNANRRINYLTNRVEELMAVLEDIRTGSGAAQTIRDAIPPQNVSQATQNPLTTPTSFSLIENRTLPQAITEYKDDVNNDTVT
jgi:hypothetical protein